MQWFWRSEYFNSQPHKEADLTKPEYVPIIEHFNSQPHKEADGKGIASGQQSSISTHSLTRRLTIRTTQVYVYVDISTHSLTRRLTTIRFYYFPFSIFQLTASQGGWPILPFCSGLRNYFNSQPHKEADKNATQERNYIKAFQLTASQGGWQLKGGRQWRTYYFNSQPHKEADKGVWDVVVLYFHFNSQPHKEADSNFIQ